VGRDRAEQGVLRLLYARRRPRPARGRRLL